MKTLTFNENELDLLWNSVCEFMEQGDFNDKQLFELASLLKKLDESTIVLEEE